VNQDFVCKYYDQVMITSW